MLKTLVEVLNFLMVPNILHRYLTLNEHMIHNVIYTVFHICSIFTQHTCRSSAGVNVSVIVLTFNAS